MNASAQIEQIAKILSEDFDGHVVWKDALIVRSSPWTELARLYGAALALKDFNNDVWLLDNSGDWFLLSTADRNFSYVAASVLQRLKYLKMFVNE